MTDAFDPQDDMIIEPEDGSTKKKTVPETSDSEEFVPEDGEGNIANAKDAAHELREKLKKAIAEKQEYLDGWQRAKADLVNARKRDEEEKRDFVKFANEGLVNDIIPALDSFDMAFANKETWEKVDKNWRVGVEYIYSQLIAALQNNGVSVVDPLGQPFDPNRDNSVELVSVEKKEEDGKVVTVLQKAYILNGKIIRPSRVKVGEYKEEI